MAPVSADFPRVENDGRALGGNRGEPTLTWVGHATFVIRLDGVTVVTDPQWSGRASPVQFTGPRRVTPPGLAFEHLPPVDVVLVSHDHYDHLDVTTVKRLAATHRPRFLVPLGLREWFRGIGITDVEELDWWERRAVRGVEITCLPAQHWIRRDILFHGKRHPAEMGAPELTRFLSSLAVEGRVAASTQNQALSGLLVLSREVLELDVPWLDGIVRAKRPVRLPVVLTRQEVQAVLHPLKDVPRLMACLLYGAGLRLLECCRLRVQDLDVGANPALHRD